jgi:thiamine biosynthesis protein ThiI
MKPIYLGLERSDGRVEPADPERVLCMISGGMDSAVASYMLLRKGFTPIFLCFDIQPYVDRGRRTALQVAMKLGSYLPERRVRMYVVPHGRSLEAIISCCPRSLTCVICRRMMFRKAERVAEREGAAAIATGESLGQKASQTLVNLQVTAGALRNLPILRPLIGMDKEEAEAVAREIGVYDLATRASCTASPKRPATKARLKDVIEAEGGLDVEGLVEQDLSRLDVIDVSV